MSFEITAICDRCGERGTHPTATMADLQAFARDIRRMALDAPEGPKGPPPILCCASCRLKVDVGAKLLAARRARAKK